MITGFEFFATATKIKRSSFHELEGHGNEISVEFLIDKLPRKAGFKHCRYRIALSLYRDRQDFEQKRGDKTVVSGCHAKAFGDGDLFQLFSLEDDTDIGTLNLAPLAMPWVGKFNRDALPLEPYVEIRIAYDPGCTYAQTSFRETVATEDPEISYVTTFESLGITADYRGRIVGTDTEQRFPMGIRSALPVSDGLLLLLDPDTGGVANPTVDCSSYTNLLRIAPSGEIDWIVEPVRENNSELYHRHAWRHENRLLTESGSGDSGHHPYIEIDHTSGAVVDVIEKFPEL